MDYIRSDTRTETAVNKGLAAILLGDLRSGIKIMRQGNVPNDVIARVIQGPESRRATDWHH